MYSAFFLADFLEGGICNRYQLISWGKLGVGEGRGKGKEGVEI